MMETVKIDCRGMQCPAPILQIAKKAREVGKAPTVLEVLATDDDFPNDLDAWCRTSRAGWHRVSRDAAGGHRALIGLNGAQRAEQDSGEIELSDLVEALSRDPNTRHVPPPPVWNGAMRPRPRPSAPRVSTPPLETRVPSPTPEPSPIACIDLRGMTAPAPLIHLSAALGSHAGRTVEVLCDDAGFVSDLMAWAASVRAKVESTEVQEGATRAVLVFPQIDHPIDHQIERRLDPAPVEVREEKTQPRPHVPVSVEPSAQVELLRAPAPTLPAVVPDPEASTELAVLGGTDPEATPRKNQCTLLVLRNDFESLMAALLVATTSRAQGMDVVIFFSFWGVNLLRGDQRRPEKEQGKVNIMQRMMKLMMPKGPRRQKLSKMNMGGMGKGMMEYLMRRNNVMSLSELLSSAVEQDVRFVVCSMSMGIMGIQKRDLMDFPNMEYAGVTCFVEQSRQSAMSLVF